ncbi:MULTISPECIES: site-specific integrase [Staphylococcus]|uniref:site-specific integrase n=1 Tax=Staphylococcus TaxID=1279 RepID=UPI0025558184|nr:site-specific integrase [Staphylococcus equorum]MDK9855234.1 site-specific integrase [Staphylococcus equorum]
MNTKNIIQFDNNKNIKFSTTSAWVDSIFLSNGKTEKKHFAVIGLKNIASNTHIIHPLSQFITDNWKNKEYNTQRKHSNNTVQFLNYLVENRKTLNITLLSDLKIKHGTQYLNNLSSSGVRRDTVKDVERTLTLFYFWLVSINVIDSFSKNSFEKKESHFGLYIESPFKPMYPSREAKEIEHTLPVNYIPLLLEVAISVAKPIALGIYFQIFGGLRVSEVINLKRVQVARRMKEGDYILKLQNQNFRTDLKEHSSVKKERSQRVLEINGWGHSLFRDHIKLYRTKDGTNALFVNRDGKAMSQRSYRQYFEKVKDHFIRLLENHGDSEQKLIAKHLRYMKWSTHIGRGTFTNIIAEDAENPYEIAHLRGDSSIDSSLTYIVSTERIHKKIEDKFSNLHEKYLPRLISRKE